jgi:hypothetical protein
VVWSRAFSIRNAASFMHPPKMVFSLLTIAQDPVHTLRATSLASPGRNVNHHTCRQEHPRDFVSCALIGFPHSLAYSQKNNEKKYRVNRRQCNTGDTVGTDMRKRSGQSPECKNKINK